MHLVAFWNRDRPWDHVFKKLKHRPAFSLAIQWGLLAVSAVTMAVERLSNVVWQRSDSSILCVDLVSSKIIYVNNGTMMYAPYYLVYFDPPPQEIGTGDGRGSRP